MQERQPALPPRSLLDILNETFVIFGRHLWQFTLLVILIEGPVVLAFLVWGDFPTIFNNQGSLEIDSADLARIVLLTFLWLFSLSIVFGAAATAVTQHYLFGRVSIKGCYQRVWWRIVSMSLSALALPVMFFLISATLLFIIPAIAIFVILVYWSVSIPAVVVEGIPGRGALVRSYNLVKGSWWRTFGIITISLLVGFGFGILVTIPFILIAAVPFLGGNGMVLGVIEFAANFISLGAVPSILFIIGTLFYLDLRVRTENYNIDDLAREMGVVKA
jgi:hypothetical protein